MTLHPPNQASPDGEWAGLQRDVEQFIYREARLADEHAYEEWESLWTDDAVYWVPAHPAGGREVDPATTMSIIYDNRSRISTRVKQYLTGKRHSQSPPSSLRRIVSNVEVLSDDGREIEAGANFLIYESRDRGPRIWAGRCEYVLRRTDGDGLAMARKTVLLADADQPLYTLAFLV
jgi:3-phenylpropionate/cinnamic acid dioxygenase small subunit